MTKYFLKCFSLFLISSISFMSFAFAVTITLKNDNIPDEDVESLGARLVFSSAGDQDFYELPLKGKSNDLILKKDDSYTNIFLTSTEGTNAVCIQSHTPIVFSNNKKYAITVGYNKPVEKKEGYCKFEEKN